MNSPSAAPTPTPPPLTMALSPFIVLAIFTYIWHIICYSGTQPK